MWTPWWEPVTAHAENGAGTKTTLYVGQEEEEEEVEEEEEDAGGVAAGGRKEKPHNPLMISVQKVRIRPGKGKGKSDGWFPQPLTHNTRRVCTDDPENKLPMHSLCPTRDPPPKTTPTMRVMWGKKGDGGFLRVLNPFFRWFAPKLRVGGFSRNCVLTRGSAPRPRTLHPIHCQPQVCNWFPNGGVCFFRGTFFPWGGGVRSTRQWGGGVGGSRGGFPAKSLVWTRAGGGELM